MMLFDIGANVGDASVVGISKGFDRVIALEPAPRVFKALASRFIYSNVIPLKYAVSDKDYDTVEFYEADEDGLSTINKDWLTADGMPYKDKPFRTVKATTITVDTLARIYGEPDLIKIDVEGSEWSVFRGMTKYHGPLCFEWTDATMYEHDVQLDYLSELGYTEVAPQFIGHHLDEPSEWHKISDLVLSGWVRDHAEEWKEAGWKVAGLRPTADVGMCWVR